MAGGGGGTAAAGGGGTPMEGSAGATVDGGGQSGASGSPMCLAGPGYGGNETTTEVATVTASIVDLSGTPVANLPAQVTGIDLSFPGTTSANHALKSPMLRFGDSISWAELAVPVTMASASLGTLTTAPLPATGATFMPGGDAMSSGVTISLATGAAVSIDQLNYSTAAEQLFRAVQIPIAAEGSLPGIAAHSFVVLYGVTPLETTFCPAARVAVPNNLAPPLAAGAMVEFWGFGIDTLQLWAPYGDWTKISDGEVSADGTTISTAAGQGFPVLESFAIRVKS
jgi:hypothetical protein